MPRKSPIDLQLKALSPAIHRLLSRLRIRIRWLVLVEGIATAVVWLVLTFWVALALDYGPVMFGLGELSRASRALILAFVSCLIAWVFYWLTLRRIFTRLRNRSLALLIERRYPQFNDSLLTTVDRTLNRPDEAHEDAAMLAHTRVLAESCLSDIELSNVVTSRPARRSLMLAGVLLLSVFGLGISNPSALKIAGQRLVLLRDTTWPRRCRIEMVGIKVTRENPLEGIDEFGQILAPSAGEFRIAKGSTLTLMVRAQASHEGDDLALPGSCSMIYRTEEGDRGVQIFKKIGALRDGFQQYTLDGPPLRGILSDISFDVRGGDHRLGPFQISVVNEPSVVETKLACRFPRYMIDESSMRWTNRTIIWSGQSSLPEGTGIKIRAQSNKVLTKVYVFDRTREKMQVVMPDEKDFEFEIPDLEEEIHLQFYLCDDDGIVSEQPHVIVIEPIEDQPPVVQTRISGIGTAVTPDVMIPFVGSISDDYGIERSWIDIEVAESEVIEEPLVIGANGELTTVIDFKQRRQKFGARYELPVDSDSTVELVVKSQDRFNLRNSPNVGIGDRFSLDVVSPNQLVRILERLEIAQRRRLEQVYLELVNARNYLARTKSTRTKTTSELVEPGDRELDARGPAETDVQAALRKQELRLLFSQRAILQVDKSINEILGSAEVFDNIRMQLINNRIDTEDKKKRFSEQIIGPLRLIGNQSMQQLKEDVLELESVLRDLPISPDVEAVSDTADQLAILAIERVDIVLNQLDQVLNVLIKFETQNELLEIVRQMIKQQQIIKERTKKERQRKAFDGLLD